MPLSIQQSAKTNDKSNCNNNLEGNYRISCLSVYEPRPKIRKTRRRKDICLLKKIIRQPNKFPTIRKTKIFRRCRVSTLLRSSKNVKDAYTRRVCAIRLLCLTNARIEDAHFNHSLFYSVKKWKTPP